MNQEKFICDRLQDEKFVTKEEEEKVEDQISLKIKNY